MRLKNRLAAAFGATAVVAASAVTLTMAPANAYSESITIKCNAVGTLADWPSTFGLTLSPTNATVGDTVNVTASFLAGPVNGPVPLGAGLVTPSAEVTLGGAMGGTVELEGDPLAATQAYGQMPGATLTGSFVVTDPGSITATVKGFLFDASSMGVSIPCNSGADPLLAPAPTPITESITAVGPTVEVTSVKLASIAPGNQALNTMGRSGDIINVSTSVFSGSDGGTLALCDANGTSNCEGAGTVTGNGTGTLTIPAGATTGARKLVATVGSQVARADFRVLDQAVITLSQAAGGTGTTVTVTGENFDPNQDVSVRGVVSTGPPPVNSADAEVIVQASATGTFTTTYTINDINTTKVSAGQTHRVPAYPTLGAVTDYADFAASANSCVAKVGAVTTGSCSIVQTVALDVTAGALSMAQTDADIDLGAVNLDGTAQTVAGDINDIVVKDYRGGSLGWTLNTVFSGLNGPVAIPAQSLTLTNPSCDAAANNNDTVVATGGTFADSSTAITLCKTTALGADGTSGGDTTAGSGLELSVGANQAAGAYVGTLTFTLQ